MIPRPTVSAVVPAYNAAATLEEVLPALRATLAPGDELILFDDGSGDATSAIAARAGARVLRNDGPPLGPAHGRNSGAAAATGRLLFFVDADVVVAPDALDRLIASMTDAHAAAAFGSYDDRPRSMRAASLYMNLRHHFMHQQGSTDATTFWGAIGLVDRGVFETMRGFDAARFTTSSIEDVELGMRMVAAGHRIVLDRDAQGTHLKDWTLGQVWRTDIVRRAIPWSELIADGRGGDRDLNLALRERLNAVLALAIVPAAGLAIIWPPFVIVFVAALVGYLVGSRRLIVFFARRLPPLKLLAAVAMHWCYHLYASATFSLIMVWRLVSAKGRLARVRSPQ